MKTMFIALAALPAIASAQNAPPRDTTQPRPVPNASAPLDPTAYCYFAGQPFSKGARHQGQVCTTGMGVAVNAMGPKQNLSWEPDRAAR